MKLARSSPSGYSTLQDGVQHKVAKTMHDKDDPMHQPLLYCKPPNTIEAQKPSISAETCKSQLGERTFNILRQAMLQQQETFIEQLWDLHKLTRSQHRRVVLLSEQPAAQKVLEPTVGVFSRPVQEGIRNQTLHDISQLPTIPVSLRRSFVATSAQKDSCMQNPLPSEADRVRMSPAVVKACSPVHEVDMKCAVPATQNPKPVQASTGPLFATGINGEITSSYSNLPGSAPAGFQFPEGPSANPYSWASANPQFSNSAFSAPLAMHGQPPICSNPSVQYLAGLQQHGGLGFAAVPQPSAGKPEGEAYPAAPAADAQAKDAAAASAQTQVDVSSLLGMMAPGLAPMQDMHQQWFQRNVNRTQPSMVAPAVSPAVLNLQKVMDVSVPEIKDVNEQTVTDTSNSVWSTSSLFMPVSLQVPGLSQQHLGFPTSDAMVDCNKFSGLPSAAAMMLPEPLGPSDAPPCGVPHQLAHMGNSLLDKDSQKKGPGTCHPDESAASILMSLKGS